MVKKRLSIHQIMQSPYPSPPVQLELRNVLSNLGIYLVTKILLQRCYAILIEGLEKSQMINKDNGLFSFLANIVTQDDIDSAQP